MNPLVKAARRAAPPIPWVWFVPTSVVLSFLLHLDLFTLMTGVGTALQVHLQLHGWMFVSLFLVGSAWCAARSAGWVSSGTVAGIRLAAFALVGREVCQFGTLGVDGVASVYESFPRLATLVWVGRNVTLVAYGYGLGLVVFASVADAVRRRRSPAWAAEYD